MPVKPRAAATTAVKPAVSIKPTTSVKPTAASIKPTAVKPNGSAGAVTSVSNKTATAAPALATGYEVKETILQVQRRYPGAEGDTDEVLEVRTFATRPASVSVSAKQRIGTIGQGGEVSVMVTVPCYAEELDAGSAYASEKVGEYLAVEQERLAELAGPDAAAARADHLPGETVDGEGEAEELTGEGNEEAEAAPADAAYIRELPDEEQFLEFCKESGVEVDMEDFGGDLDTAKEAVIAHMLKEGMITEEAEEAEEATGDDEPYTEENLKEMSLADLGEIFTAWEINNGKLPGKAKGVSEADHKKRIIATILKFQQEAIEGAA